MANEIPPIPGGTGGGTTPSTRNTGPIGMQGGTGESAGYNQGNLPDLGGVPDFMSLYNEMTTTAWASLNGMNIGDRIKRLKYLRSKGYGPNIPVSNDGLQSEDIDRYRSFLIYATVAKMNPQQALNSLSKWSTISTGPTRQKVNQADLDSVFKDVMQQKLGRGPTAVELEKFRNAYGQLEKGANPPSVSSAAEQQVATKNPQEALATKFASKADLFQRLLRSA